MKCNRCWKENVDPVYPHTCTPPLAIALADELYRYGSVNEPNACADELTRLHAENKALRAAMAEALRWCPGGCHAQYLMKTALARAGEVK